LDQRDATAGEGKDRALAFSPQYYRFDKIKELINREDIMFCKKVSVFLTMVLLFGTTGCAIYKHSRIDVRAVETYPIHAYANGILVAADPFDSSQKAKEGFYHDVTAKNFYPVNLIFRNETFDRIIIFGDTVELIDAENNVHRTVPSTLMSDSFKSKTFGYSEMTIDWWKKELPEQAIIRTKEGMNGFVYFQLPKDQTTKGCTLKLQVERLDTREKVLLELAL
jgi:hypothetical protein